MKVGVVGVYLESVGRAGRKVVGWFGSILIWRGLGEEEDLVEVVVCEVGSL